MLRRDFVGVVDDRGEIPALVIQGDVEPRRLQNGRGLSVNDREQILVAERAR